MDKLHELELDARLGRLDRRSFLKAASALGVTTALSLPTANRVFAQTSKKGGHFRLGTYGGSPTDTYDPGTYTGSLRNVTFAVCNYLMEIDSRGEAVPELAESIETVDGGLRFIIKLRKGIEFHNGKAFGPEDVIASYNHHRGKGSTSAVKGLMAQIAEIKADGPSTVVLTLSAPNAGFPPILSDYHLPIFAADGDRIDTSKMIGTGGYIISSFDPGVRATLKRNPNYWREGHGNFDSAEVLWMEDVVARTNALVSGEVDAIEAPDRSTVHLLAKRKGIKILEVTGTEYYSMLMFTDVEPFTDNNVRLALKHAVDREAIVKSVLNGYGKVGNDNPITPAYRYYNDQLAQRVYDPDKAKFLLKQAGHHSLNVELSTSDAAFTGAVDAAVLFKEQAAPAGINVSIKREPNDGYWTNVWQKKPFVMGYMGGRATADWMFSTSFASDASWNDTHWKDERFDFLLKQARSELDDAKRKEIYFEMQQIVHDKSGTIIHSLPSIVDAVTDRVQHRSLASNWPLDGNRCIDRWWFA
ncbi:ABC transporter substrate-binding protein [Microvirga sp. VF16]|uniref:ABC transporter substrate-binding protein n=1 Tax=Microvirga sp. VF16 TaxID=2807101 RepID=UPI00193E3DAE|nr:ABC transporter substrate-binding protein [Microvirga sp. VF16]QRM32282.1 twin-arginine translocation signal domain-containing protein [Microvirga sp. VF16]